MCCISLISCMHIWDQWTFPGQLSVHLLPCKSCHIQRSNMYLLWRSMLAHVPLYWFVYNMKQNSCRSNDPGLSEEMALNWSCSQGTESETMNHTRAHARTHKLSWRNELHQKEPQQVNTAFNPTGRHYRRSVHTAQFKTEALSYEYCSGIKNSW